MHSGVSSSYKAVLDRVIEMCPNGLGGVRLTFQYHHLRRSREDAGCDVAAAVAGGGVGDQQ